MGAMSGVSDEVVEVDIGIWRAVVEWVMGRRAKLLVQVCENDSSLMAVMDEGDSEVPTVTGAPVDCNARATAVLLLGVGILCTKGRLWFIIAMCASAYACNQTVRGIAVCSSNSSGSKWYRYSLLVYRYMCILWVRLGEQVIVLVCRVPVACIVCVKV